MAAGLRALGILLVVALIGLFLSAYTVDERQRALLFQLGEIKRTNIEPGLHFKLPLVQNVLRFDGRVLTLDVEPDRFLTVEKKNVEVDFFVKWRIGNTGQYYRATRGLERNAKNRIAQVMKDDLRNEFGKRTIQEAVSGERAQIMNILRENANKQAGEFGVDIVDVRISRIDLPDQVSESVYQRMEAERQRVAAEFRARGKEAAERIRAEVDRKRTVILADAYRKAQSIRGEGDAQAASVYAKAYGRDTEFFQFYRSMSAYRESFSDPSDVLLLEPDSAFFRYIKDPYGGQTAPTRAAPTLDNNASAGAAAAQ